MSTFLLSGLDLILSSAAIAVATLIGFHRGRVTCPVCARRRRLDRQLARNEAARRDHPSIDPQAGVLSPAVQRARAAEREAFDKVLRFPDLTGFERALRDEARVTRRGLDLR